jgi:hypothetical protein
LGGKGGEAGAAPADAVLKDAIRARSLAEVE